MRKKRPRGGIGDERCPRCGKRFRTLQGVADHTADVHGGRWMHRKSRDERVEDDMEWANSQMTIGEEQDFGA